VYLHKKQIEIHSLIPKIQKRYLLPLFLLKYPPFQKLLYELAKKLQKAFASITKAFKVSL
jgi:hypothetical protein